MSRSSLNYRLLERFRNVFAGSRYKHRDSSIGDSIAIELYEDLHNLHKSPKMVGINWSPCYTSYEGDRAWPTDGKKYIHPIQEAAQAESRLRAEIAGKFDEFLVLRFRATNADPFPFDWVDYRETYRDYGAI